MGSTPHFAYKDKQYFNVGLSNGGFMLVVTVCLSWSESVDVEDTASSGLERHCSHHNHSDVRTH